MVSIVDPRPQSYRYSAPERKGPDGGMECLQGGKRKGNPLLTPYAWIESNCSPRRRPHHHPPAGWGAALGAFAFRVGEVLSSVVVYNSGGMSPCVDNSAFPLRPQGKALESSGSGVSFECTAGVCALAWHRWHAWQTH